MMGGARVRILSGVMEEPIVRRADPNELPIVADTLASAFLKDRVMRWLVPDDARRLDILRSFFAVGLERLWYPHGLVFVANGVAGAAAWLPPGQPLMDVTEQEAIGAALVESWGEYADAVGGAISTLETLHPHEPHYYLPFIGVRAGWQGLGLGSALLRPMLKRSDEEGMPAYLEATSEQNRDLYRRHGFQVISPLTLPGGPTMYPMWREPRS